MENFYGIAELLLVLGGLIGFAVWEVLSLRRERQRPHRSPD